MRNTGFAFVIVAALVAEGCGPSPTRPSPAVIGMDASGLVTTQTARTIRVTFTVWNNTNGGRLPGAVVTATVGDVSVTATTDNRGEVQLQLPKTDSFRMVVTTTGFCTADTTVSPHSGPGWNWIGLSVGCA